MATITINEWLELTESHDSRLSIKKEALFKFGISLILIIAYIIFAHLEGSKKDVRLASILLPPNILGLIIILFAKNKQLIKWVTFITLLVFLFEFAFIGLSLDNTRGLIYFVSFSVLYNFELERLAWSKWLIFLFSFCTISLIFLFNIEVFLQVSIALIFLFIGGIVYQGNKRREELRILLQKENSYNLFIKHTRLIEHNVINSISKMVYVSEVLKQNCALSDPEIRELVELLDSEIQSIENVILNTDKDSLNKFKI